MLSLGFAGVVLAITQGGPSYFLQLGRTSDALDTTRQVIGPDVVVPLETGHDGERAWTLARDPLLLGGEDVAADLDRPAYRAQRIGYPLLASPWRLAGETSLLWGLFATNVVVVGAGTVVTGALAAARRAPPVPVAYAFVANPLVWLSVLFDLADALALCGVVAALVMARRGRTGWLAGASVVAALAKETSLLGLGAAALLARGLPVRTRLAMFVPGAVAAGAWRLYVSTRDGFGVGGGVKELRGAPFSGYVEVWSHGLPDAEDWVYLVITLALLGFAAWVLLLWWRDRRDLLLCTALPFAAIMPFLAAVVIDVPINSVRVIGPALTLVAVYRASANAAARRRVAGASASAHMTVRGPS